MRVNTKIGQSPVHKLPANRVLQHFAFVAQAPKARHAAGTRSAPVVRLVGTSMAAPQVARDLLDKGT